MKIYSRIHVSDLESDSRVVLKFTQDRPNFPNEKSTSFFLINDQSHFIWSERSWFPAMDGRPGKWVGGSIMEFPRPGLPWLIDSLENQFFKTSKEGGLPKGKFTVETKIDGEILVIARMMGSPGYSFRNYSRKGHTLASKKGPQWMDLDDGLLFNDGLFDQLKHLAQKVKQGTL